MGLPASPSSRLALCVALVLFYEKKWVGQFSTVIRWLAYDSCFP
jgi:hypothetical protein